MITIRLHGYNDIEKELLYRALKYVSMTHNYHDYCWTEDVERNNCETCPERHICNDLFNVQRYLNKVIEAEKGE